MWNSRPPPPFMEKTILNFHFDYLNPSLTTFKPFSNILNVFNTFFIVCTPDTIPQSDNYLD